MLTIDDLLLLVEPYCQARGISQARLSNLLFNDGKRIKAFVENNSDIASRGLREAFQWFSNHWPDGAEWPSDVPRPKPSRARAA